MEMNKINENKIIFIADTHIGSVFENISYLYQVYEFALENHVKTILHGGDLLQGTYKNVKKEYQNISMQIKHLIKDYPYSASITNKIVLGNHDFHIIKKNPNLLKEIKREDFIILGIKKAYLDWQNSIISISHSCSKYHISIPNIETLFNFCGHSHKFTIHHDNSIYIPTLSDDLKDDNNPGFLIATLNNKTILVELIEIKKSSTTKKLVYEKKIS